MDSNPTLVRRTHSPFAAANTSAPSTIPVDEHHGHSHSIGHTHAHSHDHAQEHSISQQSTSTSFATKSAITTTQGLRPFGLDNSKSLLQINKPLSGSQNTRTSVSSTSSIASGNIPITSTAHSHEHHGLFHHHDQHDHHAHDHHNHDHHNHDHHGHNHGEHQQHITHSHHLGLSHSHSHNHNHNHIHDHGHGPTHGHGHGHDHGHDHSHGHGHLHLGHDHHNHGNDNHVHNHGFNQKEQGHSHDHSNHNHHAHGFQQDHNHGHDHSAYDHSHHGHSHHGHDHSHDHSHDHHHHASTYRSQLPSYGQIFGGLMPKQKTMFTWILIHSTISVLTWISGMSSGSLSIIGFAYIMLFDAFGVLNIFISSVIHTDLKMKRSTVKNPFGVQRFEILFGLFNAIFLLFIGMNMLKESLEHLMLEDEHHSGDHGPAASIPIFWTIIGLGATLVSSLGYQNHKQFCSLLNYNTHSIQGSHTIMQNQFALTSLGCAIGVLLVAMFPDFDSLDKIVAIGQSFAMFILGGPLTKVLGMILLQTTPSKSIEGIEEAIRHIAATNSGIVKLEQAHVWTNTYGQSIGTLIIRVVKGIDEQAVLSSIHQRLQGFLDLDAQSEGTGELTVQFIHS